MTTTTTTTTLKDFVPSDFVLDEIASALRKSGYNIHPWVYIGMVGEAQQDENGFIRWTLEGKEERGTGFSGHKSWSETGDKPFRFEVLQQVWSPLKLRIKIKSDGHNGAMSLSCF